MQTNHPARKKENPYKAPESLDLINTGENTSGMGKDAVLPPGIAGWSWGAFFWNWIWALGNKTYIGLLAIIPYVGFIVAIVLGVKGREWAWRNKRWESVEHFNRTQRSWSRAALIFLGIVMLGILAAIVLPALGKH